MFSLAKEAAKGAAGGLRKSVSSSKLSPQKVANDISKAIRRHSSSDATAFMPSTPETLLSELAEEASTMVSQGARAARRLFSEGSDVLQEGVRSVSKPMPKLSQQISKSLFSKMAPVIEEQAVTQESALFKLEMLTNGVIANNLLQEYSAGVKAASTVNTPETTPKMLAKMEMLAVLGTPQEGILGIVQESTAAGLANTKAFLQKHALIIDGVRPVGPGIKDGVLGALGEAVDIAGAGVEVLTDAATNGVELVATAVFVGAGGVAYCTKNNEEEKSLAAKKLLLDQDSSLSGLYDRENGNKPQKPQEKDYIVVLYDATNSNNEKEGYREMLAASPMDVGRSTAAILGMVAAQRHEGSENLKSFMKKVGDMIGLGGNEGDNSASVSVEHELAATGVVAEPVVDNSTGIYFGP